MHTSEFDFDLPAELIAQFPQARRADSRLLVVNASSELSDKYFRDLPRYCSPGDVLVFNDTRVIPARLFGQKESGGRIEILIERVLDDANALVHIRASHAPKPGSRLRVADVDVSVQSRSDDLYHVCFMIDEPLSDFLQRHGQLPLPPYIRHDPNETDEARYQTVYARKLGAIAAPTAGLHFDEQVLNDLKGKKINLAFLTLHVGSGTFKPVQTEDIRQHRMHKERYEISAETAQLINSAKSRGSSIIAVGTTSLRALESATHDGILQAGSNETDIFITPGYQFKLVDRLVTNFHLPRSTLLMLVSAFAGLENIRKAYSHAITQRYRFFSYGDAMLLLRLNPQESKHKKGI